ncbi:methionyl-tRNA formyltransferase [Candidatus Marinimicrobia bacterium MT.SAG.3]|nr:methionyl-tRNA formyltransferase [Candidatus Marinimicrobia bacterium MT.SAG.3]
MEIGNPLNVIISGKNDLGVECSRILVDNPQINILGIIGHSVDIPKDNWQKSLIKFALDRNIPVLKPKVISLADIEKLCRGRKLDFLFSFQYEKIIKRSVLNYPELGCINVHFSLLPRNRGVYTIAWTLLNGDEEAGVTIHYMDLGIDTGDIIGEKSFRIKDEYNAQDVYQKCTSTGIELFAETLPKLITGKHVGEHQDKSKATYHSLSSIDFTDIQIDWTLSSVEVFNYIRAFIFPQFQCPTVSYGENEFHIFKVIIPSEKFENMTPGSFFLRSGHDQLYIATGDGFIVIEQFLEKGERFSPRELWQKYDLSHTGVFTVEHKNVEG